MVKGNRRPQAFRGPFHMDDKPWAITQRVLTDWRRCLTLIRRYTWRKCPLMEGLRATDRICKVLFGILKSTDRVCAFYRRLNSSKVQAEDKCCRRSYRQVAKAANRHIHRLRSSCLLHDTVNWLHARTAAVSRQLEADSNYRKAHNSCTVSIFAVSAMVPNSHFHR